MNDTLLEVKNLYKHFPLKDKSSFFGKNKQMVAVNNLSFCIEKGQTYGLVGESGCGKTTTGRSIVGLEKPEAGEIVFNGTNLAGLSEKDLKLHRKDIQMVFQNTLAALNPRVRIGDTFDDVLKINGVSNADQRRKETIEMLKKVGLSESHYFRFPHELSGGQVQRLGIGLALIIEPKLIVCDEPVSALDVSIQSQILNMLRDLQQQTNVSLLFISHDISVVRYISHKVGVMYLGSLVEEAEADVLFAKHKHPYTEALLASVPEVGSKRGIRKAILGEQQVRTDESKGCPFASRCPRKMPECEVKIPEFKEIEAGHKCACLMFD